MISINAYFYIWNNLVGIDMYETWMLRQADHKKTVADLQ